MTESPRSRALLPAALLCLLLSGAGSLTLEIVWSRWLRLVFGSTTIAVTTTLVAYMIGLGVGGLVGARWARRAGNGLRAYGMAEAALGVYALAMPLLLLAYPAIDRALSGPAGAGVAGIGRFLAALAVLMLPTLLMGASLPLVTRALEGDSAGRPGLVGLVYGVNTLGAVLGVAIASFVLMPTIGLRWTNTVGGLLDVTAGGVALFLGTFSISRDRGQDAQDRAAPIRPGRNPVPDPRKWKTSPPWLLLASYGLVGGAALANEVAWTRALSMIFSSSVHSFAVMLAAFLTGICVGSLLARRWSDRLRDPLLTYGLVSAAAGVLSLCTLVSFRFLPDLMLALLPLLGLSGRNVVVAGLVVSLVAMLGPTLLLGALFPIAARLVRPTQASSSAAIGAISFANTLGSALGALVAGFVLVPGLGLARTMSLAAAILLGVGAVALLSSVGSLARALGAIAGAAAVASAVVAPTWNRERMTAGDYYHIATALEQGLVDEKLEGVPSPELLYYRDGINATISVERIGPALNLRINGKVDASTVDRSTQLAFGHIPMLFGGKAERVMAIGYASGESVGAMTLYEPEQIDVVEIEPAVIEASRFFDDYNHRPLDDPRVRIILDDARHVLNVTDDKYDVIMSEPSNPFLSGAASLFTAEFFRAAHRALTPEGRLVQWVQLYGLEPETLCSVFATISAEFPHVYGFMDRAGAPDFVLYASDRPIGRADIARYDTLPAAVRHELQRLRIDSDSDIWSMLRLADEVRDLGRSARVLNTDDTMFVEIRALRSLYVNPSANRSLLAQRTQGALPVLDRAAAPATSEELGQLALSHFALRNEIALAHSLTEEATQRDTSSAQLAAAASLRMDEAGGAHEASAMDLLDRAVALDGRDFEARFVRAAAHLRARRYESALADVEVALAERPEHLRARRLRARLLVALGQPERALSEMRSLLETPLAELEPSILAEVAMLESASGDPQSAVRHAEQAIALEPRNVESWRRLATIERRAGNAAAAERAERNEEKARRNALVARHRTARIAWAHGDHEGARRLLRALVSEHPGYAPAQADLDRYGP